ncbi:MAG: DNA polymerase III subunit delta' [Gammaproteobacteria bacterium]|nr:DNA polymerase III subunit delta' [Gammaproteobacteria bacterium]
MDITAPLPWHMDAWNQLVERQRQSSMPHAVLLAGMSGLGKSLLADALARSLLCESPNQDGTACGQCKSCQQYHAGSHPDYRHVTPEEGKSVIGIEQCRQLSSFLNLTSHYGRYRVVILEPAEQLNVASANSLLKTLEEPSEGGILILVSDKPDALLPTIRSRCQQIKLLPPTHELASQWLSSHLEQGEQVDLLLSLSANAPLKALELANEDKLSQRAELLQGLADVHSGRVNMASVAKAWSDMGIAEVVPSLQMFFADMVRLKSSNQPPVLNNPDARNELQQIAEAVHWKQLYHHLDELNELARRLHSSLNPQMVMEDFLISWSRTRARAG